MDYKTKILAIYNGTNQVMTIRDAMTLFSLGSSEIIECIDKNAPIKWHDESVYLDWVV